MQGLSRELWLTVVYFIKPLSLDMKGFSGRLKKSWLRKAEKIPGNGSNQDHTSSYRVRVGGADLGVTDVRVGVREAW